MIPAEIVRCGCAGCLTDDCAKWSDGTCSSRILDPCTIGRVIINGSVVDIGADQRRAGAREALESLAKLEPYTSASELLAAAKRAMEPAS